MSTELTKLLADLAERGEWRGADAVVGAARAELDPGRGHLSEERRLRTKWALAVGAAIVALTLIGGGALMLAGRDGGTGVAGQPEAPDTTSAASPTTEAPVPTTTPAPVQGPMTWTRVGVDADGTELTVVVPGGPGFIAAGEANGVAAVWVSADGTSWQRVAGDQAVFGGYRIVDLVPFGDRYIAIGRRGDLGLVAWMSSDGRAWERVDIDVGLDEAEGVEVAVSALTAGPSGLVAVGWTTRPNEPWMIGDHFVIHSTDGLEWERADTSNLAVGGMKDVIVGGPGYVAVGIDWSLGGQPGVWVSPDGLSWAPIEPDGVPQIRGDDIYEMESATTGDDGRLYAFGSGRAWASSDGLTWTPFGPIRGEPESEFRNDWAGWAIAPVALGDRIVVAGALEFRYGGEPDRAAVWASLDGGRTWERMSVPVEVFGDQGSGGMFGLAERDGVYVAVGSWNAMATAWVGTWNTEDGT